MPTWHVRPYDTGDHAATVRLLDEVRTDPDGPRLDLTEVILALRDDCPAVVAVAGEQAVGAAVGRREGDQGRVLAVVIAPEWRFRGIGSALVQGVENQLLHAGCRRITTLLTPGQAGELAFVNRGFSPTGLVVYEKQIPLRPMDVSTVERWGGALLAGSEWSNLAGMETERRLIEKRLLLPVRERELAEAYGVVVPTAMLLFGPPGTGKTSFARAVAARLEWPFVELLPSRLADSGGSGLASELRSAVIDLMGVERVVVFIDEVDEIAQARDARPENQAVVNELLKAVPQFRGVQGRLLICATNSISALDPAFVRPGRFDLVLPIGPPDADGRRTLLVGLLDRVTNKQVDVDAVVEVTDMYTPADLSAVVQRAAAAAFHRAAAGTDRSASRQGVGGAVPGRETADPEAGGAPMITEDLLDAARMARPTISLSALERFRADAEAFARV
jgi:MoxR-like ATPase/GNAT superfamily N-acetyltransferase